jgi:sec-independent protein translocase protein TatC
MSFLEHLDELRKRLIVCATAIGAGMLIAAFFVEPIQDFVLAPARSALPEGSRLIYTQPTEGFAFMFNLALIAGSLLAAPVIFLQIWRFIAPGLYVHERRFAWPFVALTTSGALAGAAFAHYVAFPYMLQFLGSFSAPDLLFLPQLKEVFGLYLKMVFGMVAVFQMPTFAFFLAKMGLITAGWLWRNLRYAIFIIFVAAAVLTPSSDPWNQTVFAAPMIGLYLLSIGIAWVFGPRT